MNIKMPKHKIKLQMLSLALSHEIDIWILDIISHMWEQRTCVFQKFKKDPKRFLTGGHFCL